jgi:hypothetical protein
MEFRAEARYMRVSPQKARLVLNLIKGRRVEEARNTLAFTKKRVAATVGKLLQSAVDNANFLNTEKGLDCAGGEEPEWGSSRHGRGRRESSETGGPSEAESQGQGEE